MSIAHVSGCSDCSNKPNSPLRTTIRTIAILMAVSFMAFTATAQAASLSSDTTDYPPGTLVTLTGEGFLAFETITLQVVHADGDPLDGEGHESWTTIASGNGDFVDYWSVPWDDNLGELLLATATGGTSGLNASVSFFDNIGANLDQLQNGNTSSTPEWANGNINGSNSCYAEGDIVPYRFFLTGVPGATTHTFTISFEATKAGVHAIDYLAQFDLTESAALASIGGACSNTATSSEPGCTNPAVLPLVALPDPTDPANYAAGDPPAGMDAILSTNAPAFLIDGPGDFYGYNATAVSFSDYYYAGSASDRELQIDVTFTAIANGDVGFFWGGHLARGVTAGWGLGTGSASVSGAPYHMRAGGVDGGGGAFQDRSIQNGVICLAPDATITCDVVAEHCQGSTYTCSIPTAAGTFVWTVTGGTIVSGQGTTSITYSITAAAGETVTVAVEACDDNGGCAGDFCCNYDSIDFVVDVCCEFGIICPGDANIECDASTDPSNTGQATYTATGANCPTVSLTYTDTEVAGACESEKTITRTWQLVDGAATVYAECTQLIILTDNTAPVLAGCPADVTVECDAIPSPANVTATDNCCSPTVVFTETETPGACANAKTITRTWTASDDCGNDASCTQVITVQDNSAPVLAGCPADITVECNAIPAAATVTATDNCDASPSVAMTETEVAGACANAKTITRTWTATDACGNSSQCSQTITVEDNTAPVLAGCPADVTVECNAIPPAAATVTATDLCDASPVVTFNETEVAGACANEKIITRTWTATDACGNEASCSQTITVDDSTAPVLAGCPADVTVECDAIPAAATSVTATDNCDAAPTIVMTESEVAGACANAKTITRTWTATDACGNSSQCSQTITVEDTNAPVLAGCPADISVECDAIPNPPTVTATDNCDAAPTVVMTESEVAGACANAKTITRTWTATDACGNSSQCSQTITVDDNTAPVLAGCPTDITVECDAIPSEATVTATDNCDANPSVVMSESETPGACANAKTITRTWTATDACGNEASCVQVITVEDNTAPVLAGCPNDITVECDAIPAAATVTVTDNCDLSVTVNFNESEVAGACANAKTITRTWSATDDCGNLTQCSQTIEVVDNTAPVCLVPDDTTISLCESAQVCLPVSCTDICDANPTATVIAGPGAIVNGEWCYTPTASGVVAVTVQCEDACNNSCESTFNVTFEINSAPVCEVPDDQSIFLCDPIQVCLPVSCSDVDGNLLASQPTIISGPGAIINGEWCYSPAADEVVVVTVQCEDDCGLTCESTFTITFDLNEKPVCQIPNDSTINLCEPVEVCLPVGCTDADDNLTAGSPVLKFGPGAIVNGNWCYTPQTSETAVVTIECIDECGSASECTFSIEFVVNSAPVIVDCPGDLTFPWLGSNISETITATDADGNETITFTLGNGSPGSVDATTGVFTWNTSGASVCGGDVVIIATDDCGLVDSCAFNICITNEPPVMTCTNPDEVCWGSTITGQAVATDPDGGPINLFYSLFSFDGPGTVTVDGATGEYSWETEQSQEYAGTFELCILVTDNAELCEPCSPNNADTCCISITVVPAYQVHIEKTHGTLQGHTVEVDVYLDSAIVYADMGGYNFLIAYDASALTFMGANEGSLLTECGWEYFTYRYGANGNCDNGCPSGEIRLVAIAETNNGGNHPICLSNDGISSQLAQLVFMVTNDRTLECNYVPIRFRWYECSDNTLSSPGGDTLYLASAVYDWSGTDGQDAWIDITNTTEAFPNYTGAHYTCDDGSDPSAKFAPERCLEFFNGGVDIICADSIDARGDINLDGLAYTIADAVMFVNYFIYGLQAFIDIADTNSYGFAPGHEGSIAASDVNADGLALTVSDMVYLIRVVVGDAMPYPKVTPLNVETSFDNGILAVERNMGAAYVLVKGEVIPELLATNVDMEFEFDGINTRIIVFSYGQESFQGEFLAFEGEVLVLEMATYDGQPTITNLMPSSFSLSQNYPNPFNPSTTINFELPQASHVKLEIFNVQGRLVTTLIDERYEAGQHEYRWEAGGNSSGIYMYRLVTDRVTETKKMILLK